MKEGTPIFNRRKPKPADGITLRGKELLSHLGEAYTTKEIADALRISVNAVECHRRKLNTLFNCNHNQIKLARIAIAFGLSSPP